jgi:ubiquinone/menaquinone biosynthesis C-methylase UbiE
MNTTNTERYTHGHHESVLRSHTWRTVENSAAYLIPELQPGQQLLDVGCGPGTITIDFAERLAPGEVIGVDPSADVIAQASATAAARGTPNVRFAVGNGYALDFPDDTFDIVHAHQTLQHVADPATLLKEMYRVAKPGGVVAARDADYGGMIWYPLLPGLQRWIDTYRNVHRSNGSEPDAGRHMRHWAFEAGFADVECTGTMWTFAAEADRRWWGGMWADRVRNSSFAEQAVSRGYATDDGIDAIRAAWLQWIDEPGAWFAIPNGEIVIRK